MALDSMELAVWTKLDLNLQPSCLLCLLSARIIDMPPPHLA